MARTDYNGWRNRQTWNCALWIGNDEGLYRLACDFMRSPAGRAARCPYGAFCRRYGLAGERTPDNIAWMGVQLDYSALNDMMRELVDDYSRGSAVSA